MIISMMLWTVQGYASGSFGPTTAGRMRMCDNNYGAMTVQGYASGSFGPTTAGRMDSYVDQFQEAGGSLVMLAKGNRSKQVWLELSF